MQLWLAKSLENRKNSVQLRLDSSGFIVDSRGDILVTLSSKKEEILNTHLSQYTVESGLAAVYQAFLKARFNKQPSTFSFTHDTSIGWEVSWDKKFGYIVNGMKFDFDSKFQSSLLKVLDSLPVLVSYVDKDLKYQFNNLAYESFFNIPREKLLNKPVKEFIGETAFKNLLPIYKQVLAGNSHKATQIINLPNGKEKHVVIEYNPSFCGRVVDGFYAVIQDVTEYRSSSQLLKKVYQAINEQVEHPDEIINQLLEMGRKYLGLDIGIISYVEAGVYKVDYLSTELDGIEVNDTFPLGDTYCAITLDKSDVVSSEYVGIDTNINTHPCYENFKLECYVGVPLVINNHVWGTLNYSSPSKRKTNFNELEHELMRLLGKAIEKLITNKQTIQNLNRLDNLNHMLNEASKVAKIGFWEYDANSQNIYWSDGVYNIFAISPGSLDITYDTFFSFVAKEDRDRVEQEFENSVSENRGYFITHKIITAKNETKIVEERGQHTYDESGELVKSVGSVYDVTTKYYSEKKFKDLLENASDGIHILDLQGNVVECSLSFAEHLGYTYEEALQLNVRDWDVQIPEDQLIGAILDLIQNPRAFETKHKLKDGTVIDVQINAKGIILEGGQYLYASQRDITALKKAEEKLSRIALYDDVTGIPNRTNFLSELPKSISRAKRNEAIFAVFFIDLDNFKLVNDKYGHHCGDLLLKAVVKRWLKVFRNEDRLARIGGDEFAAIIEPVDSFEQVRLIAQRCIDVGADPYDIDGIKLYQYFSIGVSLYPDSATTGDKLVQYADTAMYRAKEKGKNNIVFFREELDQRMQKHCQIQSALRLAVTNRELSVLYQPQYSNDCQLIGVEALLRWQNDDYKHVTPSEFIPISEKSRQIIQIGQWVLLQALDDWNILAREHQNLSLQLAINISSVQLYSPTFTDDIKALLSKKGFNPKYLTLEITETNLIEDIEHAKGVLTSLTKLGVKIALDDFGTGHSSLHYLANLPISYLKIDKSFVLNADKHNNHIIIKSIISLSKNFKADCIAEGVETPEQFEFLKQIGCDKYQGFYFSKPVPINTISKLLG